MEEIGRERQRVEAFKRTARSARRSLANIPTYMIFDDHEVTDDWNLNRTSVSYTHLTLPTKA